MANLQLGPKVRNLNSKETLSSLETWKQTILYGLRLNPDFRPYIGENVVFGRKSKAKPFRSLVDTIRTETVEDAEGNQRQMVHVTKSREEKVIEVDLMLEQIANYATNIPRQDITRNSASLAEVWQNIRQYFNIQQSGSLLNEVWNIKREYEESPQALFGRMKQMYLDNLLTVGGLEHVDGQVDEDEELSPTLHNTIVLHWLQVLDPGLRDLVTQRFITQLRNTTYAALFPEISRSVESLLEELNHATANRSYPLPPRSYSSFKSSSQPSRQRTYQPSYSPATSSQRNQEYSSYNPNSNKKGCDFCKLTGKRKYMTHKIDQCLFIQKLNSASARQVDENETDDDIEEHYQEFYNTTEESARFIDHIINRINIDASPVLTFHSTNPTEGNSNEEIDATFDTGATVSLLKERKARKMNAIIRPTSQKVRMADGRTNLEVVGETETTIFRNGKPFHLAAVVCRFIDCDLLAGMPFMKSNDVAIRPYSNEIILNGSEIINYSPYGKSSNTVRRITIQSDQRKIILPGESLKVKVPNITNTVAIEPRWSSSLNKVANESQIWPKPEVLTVTEGSVSLNNFTSEPIIVRKLEHIGDILPEIDAPKDQQPLCNKSVLAQHTPKPSNNTPFSNCVKLNPHKLFTNSEEGGFKDLLITYDEVFNPAITGYNGKSGKCFVEVNIGPNKPTQRKGRLPYYGKDNLVELQDKFDELQSKGILSRPQDIGITVENTNPSFLVKKQPPSTDKRLVTDFSSIATFCRPTPSLLPNVESTLHNIASWKYLIKSDMSSAYHQIEMKKESKKYCGVHTPYKGLLVYNRGVMGLPGVEVALEELTCLLLGEFVKKGSVAKIADDLFIGGNTVEELKNNFHQVLQKLLENNIKLSATKTVIAPKSVIILGWMWSAGQLTATPHRLSALATCPEPDTVSSMKSYLGAYRFLSRVIQRHANLLAPLENAIKGKDSKDKLIWSDELSCAFKRAKDALSDAKAITIPRKSDLLCIVTDASVRPGAVGATLYAIREGKPLLAGFYNSKLPEFQTRWLPCEIEGLGIATALNHFSAYIIQSDKKPQVLTDSKPCVESVLKLQRGEFSASARLSSFLSSVSRYQAQVLHISGKSNLPSDYLSRNPLNCDAPNCSICKFVKETMTAVVNNISVEDILQGRVKMPYTNRNTWKSVQDDCSDLRKVKQFKSQGTIPNRKAKNLKLVRKYISSGTLLTHDNLLVNPVQSALGPINERIVVPQNVLHGILTVLHLRLCHPTAFQLSKAFNRYFYAINLDKAISEVTKGCHQCESIKEVPKAMIKESSEIPPTAVGGNFAADIIKRCSQRIFIIRETVTAYTLTDLIPNEQKETVVNTICKMCNLLRPSSAHEITIRLDPAPAHQSMFKDLAGNSILAQNNIVIEIGRTLNVNKNPVIDKACKELTRELLIINPTGGPSSTTQLSQATANLNSRYRNTGLSAHEIWTQRDQITGEQLPIQDREIIISQHKSRLKNHPHSEKAKAAGKPWSPEARVKIGSLVYVTKDREKVQPRPRYLVTSIDNNWVKMRRFSKNLFGTKEYDAKLTEIYSVPSFDSLNLSEENDNEDSDNDYDPWYTNLSTPFQNHHDHSTHNNTNLSDHESVSSESSSDSQHDVEPDVVPVLPLPNHTSPIPRRTPRLRREPSRFGDIVKH